VLSKLPDADSCLAGTQNRNSENSNSNPEYFNKFLLTKNGIGNYCGKLNAFSLAVNPTECLNKGREESFAHVMAQREEAIQWLTL
jgi:hypothetical protein